MKKYLESLFVVQKYLIDHDNIKCVSVARNGLITIVFDHSYMSVDDAKKRMSEYGIEDYTLVSDWRSNSIFIKI